ncbi:hypothetical protein DZF91_34965 [Actinomadura logoneensis]|uniref:Glycosyltransferase RgtA/B/C/D-like domain-containing protein n=1 Tax=Actinomadura logoneensis TaxID=2293572 RepID=A0A372JAJ6_9ACTN|nr:hypothetical protein [Actinomadura logoneensis]RFU37041.1 hypothetical protein DZF91_34965 [Actinomadura logoneensis]
MTAVENISAKPGGHTRRAAWRTRPRRWRLLLVGGFLAQVAVRLVLGAWQTGPVLIPDETGYLLAARLLAGGAVGNLSGRVFYHSGYSLLISPAYWVTDDPATVYRLVIGLNAFLSAALVIPAYLGARRMGLRKIHAWALAQGIALLPGLLYYTQFALSDAVLPTLVSAWLLAVHTWLRKRDVRFGLAAAGLAAFTYCTHPRGVVILLVQVVLLLAVPFLNRRMNRRDLGLVGLSLTLCAVLAWNLNLWVRHALYPAGAASMGHLLVQRLTSVDGLLWTASLTAGKIWYLVVSTWGLAGVGLTAVIVLAVRPGVAMATRATAGTALTALGGIAVATSAAVPDEGTVANHAYGRYLVCLAPFFALAGGAALLRAKPLDRVRLTLGPAGFAAVSGAVVAFGSGDRLRTGFFGPFDFPEICFLTWNWSGLHLWSATWTALVVLMVAVLASASVPEPYARRGMIAALVSLNLAVAGVTTDRVSSYWVRQLTPRVSLRAAGLRPHDRVAMSYRGMGWRIWVSQAFEVRSGLVPFDRFDRRPPAASITLIVVPWSLSRPPTASWPAAQPGWHVVTALDGGIGGWAAWRRDGT